MEETEDALLGGRVRLRQPARGYRAAIDPVLLAAAVPVAEGARVIDLGCGVGAAALCLLSRVPSIEIVGLDIQPELVRLANQNAAINGITNRFRALSGDILALPSDLPHGPFDHVMCNPPYLPTDAAAPSDASRAVASREGHTRLSDWVHVALSLVRPKGGVTFIHRADRLDALLAALHERAGEIVIFPCWPGSRNDKPEAARRVLVRARNGISAPTRLAPGIVLHRPDGRFTPEAEAVLRRGRGLEL